MSAAAMLQPITGMSPSTKARIAGLLYLLNGQAVSFSEFSVRTRLIVFGDPAATANNILAHENLYRLGFAAELLPLYVIVTIMLYDLLKPVNKSLSLMAAAFSLVGGAVQVCVSLLHFAPLIILKNPQSSAAFTTSQLQTQALQFLRLGAEGFNVIMVFFGFHCILLGYLIFKSTFLPRIIGVLLAIAGACYLTNSFTHFLAPAFAPRLLPYILWPGFAELILILWLIIMGVNCECWREQAGKMRLYNR